MIDIFIGAQSFPEIGKVFAAVLVSVLAVPQL